MSRLLLVLLFSLEVSLVGCGGARGGKSREEIVKAGVGEKKGLVSGGGLKSVGGLVSVGSEKRVLIECGLFGVVRRYEWRRMKRGDMPYDRKSGVWRFLGLNEGGEVVEVLSSMCWVESKFMSSGVSDWGAL